MAKAKAKNTPAAPETNSGLAITNQKQKVLSKPQQAFNRLVKKIEKLQHDIALTTQVMDEKLEYYGKNIYPLEKQLVDSRKQVVKLLFPFYTAKKPLSKRDKETLKNILISQLNDIFFFEKGEPDPELEEIFQELEGMNFEEAAQQDLEEMKDEMTAMFESFGFKMNFDDLNPNMSEEDMLRKMHEMEDQVKQQSEQFNSRASSRKKTKKQLEKEERERQAAEIKNKSIGRIYKQLAKVLHPDLEQDPEQKAYKELRMRELTTAYEDNDLHTLLRLELEWLQKEENNLEQLTDEKLSIYNELLKEQAAALEEEQYMQLQHPRYQPLFHFVMFPTELKHVRLPQKKKELEESLTSLTKSIIRLESPFATEEVKELIRYFRQAF